MAGGLLIFVAVFWVLPIFVGHRIGAPKGRQGWLWGLLLGWIGVIIVACLSDKTGLTAKQRQVAELEADLKLAELQKRQAELSQHSNA
jgi:TM2 domain-containing membrane protein YozV